MRKIFLSLAAAFVVTWPSVAATTQSKTAKHKPASTSKSKAGPATARAGKKSAASSTTAKSASAKGSAVKARTKSKSKTVRQIRSYQQAPTPQRYQEIQQALAGKGYFQGEANGKWGTDSVDALKRFQADQNLMPDGKISSLSLIALGLGPKRLSAQSAKPSNQPAPAAAPQ